MRQKKKTPADFSSFTFRIDREDRDDLNVKIKTVKDCLNKKLSPDEKPYTSKEIIANALHLGLENLSKRKRL